MKRKNIYIVDVWQPTSMVVAGAQAYQTKITTGLREELCRYNGSTIISAIKRPIYTKAIKQIAGFEFRSVLRDLEFIPGDVIIYVKSVGEPLDSDGEFPEGNTLAVYRIEIYSNDDIYISDPIDLDMDEDEGNRYI